MEGKWETVEYGNGGGCKVRKEDGERESTEEERGEGVVLVGRGGRERRRAHTSQLAASVRWKRLSASRGSTIALCRIDSTRRLMATETDRKSRKGQTGLKRTASAGQKWGGRRGRRGLGVERASYSGMGGGFGQTGAASSEIKERYVMRSGGGRGRGEPAQRMAHYISSASFKSTIHIMITVTVHLTLLNLPCSHVARGTFFALAWEQGSGSGEGERGGGASGSE